MEEIDNHIGRGGSLLAFSYYNDCIENGGLHIVDVDEYRNDEVMAITKWPDKDKMKLKYHVHNDPLRDVRVAIHQLMHEIHEKYDC